MKNTPGNGRRDSSRNTSGGGGGGLSPPSSRPPSWAAPAMCLRATDRHGRHRLRHAGTVEHALVPRASAKCSGSRSATWTTSHLKKRGNRQHADGNTGLRHLQGLPRAVRAGDLDAVSIAVPDQWHAILAIAALRAGLDVFGEKPFTHSLREGRAFCDSIKRYGRVWQTGSWQRSDDNFYRAADSYATAGLGRSCASKWACHRPLRFRAHLRAGETRESRRRPRLRHLDPPRARVPHCTARVHMNWRWNMDFGGGQLIDWIGHHLDIAQWGLDTELHRAGGFWAAASSRRQGIYNSATRYWVGTQSTRTARRW